MTDEQLQGDQRPWIEQFREEHPIDALPVEARDIFSDLLVSRQGILDYYTRFPYDGWDERIGAGNSAREDLGDLIATTAVRAEATRSKKMDSWEHPNKEKIRKAGNWYLLEHLKSSAADYYEALIQAGDLTREIPMPFGKRTTHLKLLDGAKAHEVGHLFFAIKFGDQLGEGQPIERPASVAQVWGH